MSSHDSMPALARTLKASLAAVGLAVCLTGAASAEAGALEGGMTAHAIERDDAGNEVAVEADTIAPGGIIEYEMTYRNVSEDTLSAITIDGRVPANTAYLAGSQLATRAALFEARAPGIEWQAPPLTRVIEDEDGTPRTVEVPAEDYTGIRWRMADALPPEGDVSFTYRVRVDG